MKMISVFLLVHFLISTSAYCHEVKLVAEFWPERKAVVITNRGPNPVLLVLPGSVIKIDRYLHEREIDLTLHNIFDTNGIWMLALMGAPEGSGLHQQGVFDVVDFEKTKVLLQKSGAVEIRANVHELIKTDKGQVLSEIQNITIPVRMHKLTKKPPRQDGGE